MTGSDKSLDAARRDIDAIDDDILDLLMRRAALVDRVRAAKGAGDGASLRPAREAAVLRRLLARSSEPFPADSLVSIWREIFAAMLRLQGPFTVAVCDLEQQPSLRPLARAHFGTHTPVSVYGRPGQVVAAVREQGAALGILPLPGEDGEAPWWRYLLSADPDRIRIVGRLPQLKPTGHAAGDGEALVIARAPFEDSGDDNSFLVFQAAEHVSRGRLQSALAAEGLTQLGYAPWQEEAQPRSWFHFVELAGHVDGDHAALGRLADSFEPAIDTVFALGGYPLPLDAEAIARTRGEQT